MKKSIILVAIAALTLASCTKESITSTENGIVLTPNVQATKAVIGSTTFNFPATLVGDNGTLFNSQAITVQNGVDIVTGVNYDATKAYKFYAVTPELTNLTADKTSGTVAMTGTKDVMYASTGTFLNDLDVVNRKLSFNHVLTQLQFQIKAENAAAITRWGTITSISVIDQPSIITVDVKTGNLTAGTALASFTTVNTPLAVDAAGYKALAGTEPVIMTMPTAEKAEILFLIKTSVYTEGVTAKVVAPVGGFAKGKSHMISLTLKETVTANTPIEIEAPTVVDWVVGNQPDVVPVN